MRTLFSLVGSLLILTSTVTAQNSVSTFIFGNSLVNHELQVNITSSQETSVPHWFEFLADEAGYAYAVSGQYGFLNTHVNNLPPVSQWWFDTVAGAWDSDNQLFSDVNFDNIIITPANFIQWQGPADNYFGQHSIDLYGDRPKPYSPMFAVDCPDYCWF